MAKKKLSNKNRSSDAQALLQADGLLLRWSDGTLYFLPREELEKHRVNAPELQPGTEKGDELQSAFDRLPPVFRIKNAIRTLGETFDDLFDMADVRANGVFKPKTQTISRLAEEFPVNRSYRAWHGFGGRGDSDF